MLVQTERTLALRCSACGRLHVQAFSLFDFSRDHDLALQCACGFQHVGFERRGRTVRVRLACLICDASHQLFFPSLRFLSGGLLRLVCPRTGVQLGWVGEPAAVTAAQAGEDVLENLVFDPECVDYFENPQVMHDTLASVQAMAEVGTLRCACGNGRVELDIYPEKIELMCSACGSTVVLHARTEEDRRLAVGLRGLTLPATRCEHEGFQPGSRRTKG